MERYLRVDTSNKSENDYITHLLTHKLLVSKYMDPIISDLIKRSTTHDDSKMSGIEKDMFVEIGVVDEGIEYYSNDYIENIENGNTAIAVAKHYETNDHHPEHHSNGIDDMDLIQLLEMLVDWKVGGLSYTTGSILYSIDKNIDRFGIEPQLVSILKNTAKKYLGD